MSTIRQVKDLQAGDRINAYMEFEGRVLPKTVSEVKPLPEGLRGWHGFTQINFTDGTSVERCDNQQYEVTR